MAFRDRVKFTTSTTGTGPVTVGAASSGFQTPATAGLADGETASYAIEDGTAWETGLATYTVSGTILSRQLEASSTGSLLNLSGSAVMYLTPTAALMNARASIGQMLAMASGQVMN